MGPGKGKQVTNLLKRSLIYGVLTLSCGVGAAIMIKSTAAMNRAEYVSTQPIGRLDRVWELARYNAASREGAELKGQIEECLSHRLGESGCTRQDGVRRVSRLREIILILKSHGALMESALHRAELKYRRANRQLETLKHGHASSNLDDMNEPPPGEKR